MAYEEIKEHALPSTGKAIIFYSSENRKGLVDATGAFIPEAHNFKFFLETELFYNSVELVPINAIKKSDKVMQNKVLDALSKHTGGVTCVAFFCHGWPTGIEFGFNFRNVSVLAEALSKICERHTVIPLYCCSTADNKQNIIDVPMGTDGGFADLLRDKLCKRGVNLCRVVAHRTAGHTTQNPNVVFFEGDGTQDGRTNDAYIGGEMPVSPKDGRIWHTWIDSLRGKFRFLMLFLYPPEIRNFMRKS